MAYSYRDLLDVYERLGVENGMLLYVLSDLRWLMEYEEPGEAVLKAHVDALRELIGPSGTIVMAASSMNLCNTEIVFDAATTPSYKVGVLAEYFRTLPGSVRSFHPFVSVSANGPLAEDIVENVSRHAFGPETPQDRMLEMGAKVLSIGLHPRMTVTTVHHIEHVMAVPYRYTKEYLHPVMRNGNVAIEPFYRYVWYQDSDIERDKNVKLMAAIEGELDMVSADVGRGKIWTHDLNRFYKLATREYAKDIYLWCSQEPTVRPWRK